MDINNVYAIIGVLLFSCSFKVGQQPQRMRENHVVVEFRDGEHPVAQRVNYEDRQPPFREILAIVGADFVIYFPPPFRNIL